MYANGNSISQDQWKYFEMGRRRSGQMEVV